MLKRLYLFAALLVASEATAGERIEFVFKGAEGQPPRVRSLPIPPKRALVLDLGDEVARLRVIGTSRNPGDELVVEQRFETSVSIQSEGPHHDLTEWRHGHSDWHRLEATSPTEFGVLPLPEGELPFPNVTTSEIVNALKRKGVEEHWRDLAAGCATARTEPCAVGVSRILFRAKRKAGREEKILWQAVAKPPMGC